MMTTISGKAKLAGVFGWPVQYSQSPRLHGFWLHKHQIDGAYVPLAVQPDDFETALRALPKLGFAGANVTAPHKEQTFQLVDRVDAVAKRLAAVNTIVVEADGSLTGSNTDGFGFIENLTAGAPEWQAKTGPAVVLGAGGAARAIVAALLDAGVPELILLNRTRQRADELAAEIGGNISVIDWAERSECLDSANLLVNTTTLGMSGKGQLDISLEPLPTNAVVTDIVYAPLKTPLLAQAEQRGNQIVDGLGMLLHQARPGFESWFDQPVKVTDDLREFVLFGR